MPTEEENSNDADGSIEDSLATSERNVERLSPVAHEADVSVDINSNLGSIEFVDESGQDIQPQLSHRRQAVIR